MRKVGTVTFYAEDDGYVRAELGDDMSGDIADGVVLSDLADIIQRAMCDYCHNTLTKEECDRRRME